MGLTEFPGPCYGCTKPRFFPAAHSPIERNSGLVADALAVYPGTATVRQSYVHSDRSGSCCRSRPRGEPDLPGGPRHPAAVLGGGLGRHCPETGGVPQGGPPDGAVHPGLPEQRQVLGRAVGVPVAGRQPARRDVPRRLRRAERPAAAGAAGRQSGARPLVQPQELAAVDRALLRASSAEVNKLEKSVTFLATTASITPFIGLFGTVWGSPAFTSIGAQGSTDLRWWRPALPRRWWRRPPAVRCHPGRLLLQPPHDTREGVRDRDGRLRPRVPEHLGKELHLVPKVLPQPEAGGGRRRGRRVSTSPPRSTSSRWWT